MKKQYFFLNANTKLVATERNSAIYDFSTGNILALEPTLAAILRLTERGLPTDEIATPIALPETLVDELLNGVLSYGLGKFYDRRIYIERNYKHPPKDSMRPPVISRCYIDLPYTCTLECVHCRAAKIYACALCSIAPTAGLDERALYTFLRRLLKLQCRSLVFRGGDPLSHLDSFAPIIAFCREQGFTEKLFVNTNAKNIGKLAMRVLANYKVHPVIPFGGDSSGFISEESLSYLVKQLHENRIEFSITLVFSNYNAASARHMRAFVEQLGAASVFATSILSDKPEESMTAIEALGNRVMRVSGDLFYRNKDYHPCMNGTIAVGGDGKLRPCPLLTCESLGSIATPRIIDEIFETGALDKYWELSLSQIGECKECAFRFGCLDCRAIEQSLTASLHGKSLCALVREGCP